MPQLFVVDKKILMLVCRTLIGDIEASEFFAKNGEFDAAVEADERYKK